MHLFIYLYLLKWESIINCTNVKWLKIVRTLVFTMSIKNQYNAYLRTNFHFCYWFLWNSHLFSELVRDRDRVREREREKRNYMRKKWKRISLYITYLNFTFMYYVLANLIIFLIKATLPSNADPTNFGLTSKLDPGSGAHQY